MTYKLAFKPSAKKEWEALDGTIRSQFKKVLVRRLESPHVASASLRGMPGCYKIKLKALGYRLVYEVIDETVTVTVIAVGKRERGLIYTSSSARLKD